jgi:hypothetical protein
MITRKGIGQSLEVLHQPDHIVLPYRAGLLLSPFPAPGYGGPGRRLRGKLGKLRFLRNFRFPWGLRFFRELLFPGELRFPRELCFPGKFPGSFLVVPGKPFFRKLRFRFFGKFHLRFRKFRLFPIGNFFRLLLRRFFGKDLFPFIFNRIGLLYFRIQG